jgi:hypothetical protein
MRIRVLPEMWQNLQASYVIMGAAEATSDLEDDGAGGTDVYMRRGKFSTLGREEGRE